MNHWIAAILAVIAALLGALGILAAIHGDWSGVAGTAAFLVAVGFFAGAGWFCFRFPLPPRAPNARSDPLSELRRFRAHYPGWPSTVVSTAVALLVVLFLVGQVLYWRGRP